MATAPQITNHTIDTLMEFKDAGAVTTSAAAQVGGSDKIIDIGASTPTTATPPTFHADMVVDVSAMDIVSNDEIYTVVVEGSDKSDFADTIEELATLRLGALETLSTDTDVDSTTGRYILSFSNQRHTRRYRYLRVYHVIAGTTPSINYTATAHVKQR